MANADIYEYALTYKLDINFDDKTVGIKLLDKPEVGETFITPDEIGGIISSIKSIGY
jgi:hypothetical protein